MENALDIVIDRAKITIEGRITVKQVLLVEAAKGSRPAQAEWPQLAAKHERYVLAHLRVEADGKLLTGNLLSPPEVDPPKPGTSAELAMVQYRLEYPLPGAPQVVRIGQDMLSDVEEWACSCAVRIRQSNQPAFQIALLTQPKFIEFGSDWPQSPDIPSAGAIRTEVRVWPTVQAYAAHGIEHILTGYDHLLFVSALVLAAKGSWDLIKVVTMFTIAHTLTLTLSVFNVLTLSERVVEPMIAASIVFVALQNIFWPKHATGWSRLAVAFAFGLFHGLGFAGGLKQAMSNMPVLALGLALAAFSVGVEIGHQVVVLPMFGLMQAAKQANAGEKHRLLGQQILKFGSCAISVAGLYFLIQAIK